jgi:hypothetical protein
MHVDGEHAKPQSYTLEQDAAIYVAIHMSFEPLLVHGSLAVAVA